MDSRSFSTIKGATSVWDPYSLKKKRTVSIAMRKAFTSQKKISLEHGTNESRELEGIEENEQFILDVRRNSLRVSRYNLQTRGRNVVVLVRLDVNGAPHRNPDGKIIEASHIHVYQEGFEDKWAYPLKEDEFENPNDVAQTFQDFCHRCAIERIPFIQQGLQ